MKKIKVIILVLLIIVNISLMVANLFALEGKVKVGPVYVLQHAQRGADHILICPYPHGNETCWAPL